MANDKLNKLKLYVEDVKFKIRTTDGPKKEFWERELRKTQTKIGELTK